MPENGPKKICAHRLAFFENTKIAAAVSLLIHHSLTYYLGNQYQKSKLVDSPKDACFCYTTTTTNHAHLPQTYCDAMVRMKYLTVIRESRLTLLRMYGFIAIPQVTMLQMGERRRNIIFL